MLNQDSIDAVTKDAQNLLTIAQSFFASSTGYSDVYAQVTAAIQALMNNGSLYTASPDRGITGAADNTDNSLSTFLAQVQASGKAGGGLITNGIRGVDSLFAHVAGGEFVTKTSSVNPSTLSTLQYINNTGRNPKQDNSDVVGVLTQGFNNQTQVLSDRLDNVADRIKRLEDTTRQASNQRRVPGSDRRAA